MFQKFSKNIYNVLNYNKIVTLSHPQTISDKIKVAWQVFSGTLYYGTQSCYHDFQLKQKLGTKFTSSHQLYQSYHISRELQKSIPFLILFVLPGSAALLPIYASLFPNAIPTNFLFEEQFQNRTLRKQRLQYKATSELFRSQNLIRNITNATQLKEDFILKKNRYEKEYNIANLSSDQLNLICQHLQMEYITLNFVFNEIYHFIFNIHNYAYNLYYFATNQTRRRQYVDPYKIINIARPFFVEYARQKILLQQIQDQFVYLNNQDYIHQFQDQFYLGYAAERGISKRRLTQEEYNNDWVRFTQQLTISQKIWFSVLYSQLQ